MKLSRLNQLNWLKIFLILVIVIGIFLRFINLDSKVYWLDEASTSARISGYTEREINQTFFSGTLLTPKEVHAKFQYPNSEKTVIDTIKTLVINDIHPPLYHVTLRYWVKAFGNSIAVIKSWSAVLSLLAFPLLYWLCLELFGESLVGWIAMALYAISPYQLAFAQTARYYSLWTALILASCLALLRALRLNNKKNWFIYGTVIVLGLYTFLIHILIVIQNGIYTAISEKFRWKESLKAYLLTTFISLLVFSPWLIVYQLYQSNLDSVGWAEVNLGIKNWLSIFIYNLVAIFVNFWYYVRYFPDWPHPILPWARFFIPFVLLIVGYAFYTLARYAPRKASFFLLSLISIFTLYFAIPDLVHGGIRALVERYLSPAYLGIQIVVAYLLARQLTTFSEKAWLKRFWQGVTVILITGGLISCLLVSPAKGFFGYWQGKQINQAEIAEKINQSDQPLVFMFANAYDILVVTHVLKPETTFQVAGDWQLDKWLDKKTFRNFFLYETAPIKAEEFQKANQNLSRFKMDLIYDRGGQHLWKIEANP